jgi:hypothetical protein
MTCELTLLIAESFVVLMMYGCVLRGDRRLSKEVIQSQGSFPVS